MLVNYIFDYCIYDNSMIQHAHDFTIDIVQYTLHTVKYKDNKQFHNKIFIYLYLVSEFTLNYYTINVLSSEENSWRLIIADFFNLKEN
jgi:hypothetical protein